MTRNGTTTKAPLKAAPRRRAPWLRLGFATAAALLLATLSSWMLGIDREPPEVGPGPGHAAAPADEDVLARVMQRHLKLAEGLPAAERLQVLAGMADDLRGESLRQAQAPAAPDAALLARLSRMYRQSSTMAWCRGPAACRRSSTPGAAAAGGRSCAAEGEAERRPADGPGGGAVAARPRRDGPRGPRAARQAADGGHHPMKSFLLTLWSAALLTGGLAVADDPPDVRPADALLEKVVSQSLRLADEEDPLRRATWCAELADDLAEGVTLASARRHRGSACGWDGTSTTC